MSQDKQLTPDQQATVEAFESWVTTEMIKVLDSSKKWGVTVDQIFGWDLGAICSRAQESFPTIKVEYMMAHIGWVFAAMAFEQAGMPIRPTPLNAPITSGQGCAEPT